MRLAIMQPYFFPYLGYFQLLYSVDKFVVLDDVGFIKRGWINRNQILVNGMPALFTIPVKQSGSSQLICDVELADTEFRHWRESFGKTLKTEYARAPHFAPTMALIGQVVDAELPTIRDLALRSIELTCQHLGIDTELAPTSRVYANAALKGQERILDICSREQTTMYVNPIGGRELYDHAVFAARQVQLRFLETLPYTYSQFGKPFQPNLSMIDVLMFAGVDGARQLLESYRLVE